MDWRIFGGQLGGAVLFLGLVWASAAGDHAADHDADRDAVGAVDLPTVGLFRQLLRDIAASREHDVLMRAEFIGADGSLGYRHGQVYDLVLSGGEHPTIVRPRPCPYGSWAAFWRNWRQVEQRGQ